MPVPNSSRKSKSSQSLLWSCACTPSLATSITGRGKLLGAIPFLFEPGNIAFSIASGHGFASPFRVETGPTAWMTPIYPEILAGIFQIFGKYTYNAFLAAALLNVAFSTLTCIPLYFAAKRIGGLTLGCSRRLALGDISASDSPAL